MIEITEADKKLLESLPKYDGKNKYVETRDYWESVFEEELNRDPELHKAFEELHEHIVEEVLNFCREHNITDAYEFNISADGIHPASVKMGLWTAAIDSCMTIYKGHNPTGYKNLIKRDEDPFLKQY